VIPSPFAGWLRRRAFAQPLVVDPEDLNREAVANWCSWGQARLARTPVTAEGARAFVDAVVTRRRKELRRRHVAAGRMLFYCWRDELGSLEWSAVSSSHGKLPFGCRHDRRATLDTIVAEWLGWEMWHPDDPRAIADRKALAGKPTVLKVWVTEL
jgi:hypothetical protein